MESTLLSVTSKAKSALEVTFTHLDAEDTYSVSLEENSTKIWRVSYMEDGTRKELVGRVAKITKYDQQGPVKEYRPGIVDLVLRTTSGYKVTFDTSDDFKAGSVTIDAKDIRSIKDVETVPCPDPGQTPKPIMVPADAFNFIQQIYPDKYMILDHIPNRLITDKTVNASAMFSGCTMLKMVRPMNTRNMTSMSAMFAKCNNLEEIPMMDTSRVMSMGGMFNDCFILLHTDKPSNFGSIISSKIRSGFFSNAILTAEIPSLASIVLYPSFSKLHFNISLIGGSSSTISIFFASFNNSSSTKIPPFYISFIFIVYLYHNSLVITSFFIKFAMKLFLHLKQFLLHHKKLLIVLLLLLFVALKTLLPLLRFLISQLLLLPLLYNEF